MGEQLTFSLVSNATLRILTALVGIPLLLGTAYLGGWYFGVVVLVVALVGQHELYGMMEAGGLRPHRAVGLVMGGLVAVYPLVALAPPLVAALFFSYLAYTTFFDDEERKPLPNLASTVFGVVYPSAMLAALLALREARGPTVDSAAAFWLTLGTFVLIWLTDTGAYYVGRAVGRRPLAPRISPNKTWEGALGGAAGALVGAGILKGTLLSFLAWPHLLAMALICGVLSQLGDLAESRFKRSVGVKDAGQFLPGHGGILDRFDALLLAVPLVYLYLAYVAHLFA